MWTNTGLVLGRGRNTMESWAWVEEEEYDGCGWRRRNRTVWLEEEE